MDVQSQIPDGDFGEYPLTAASLGVPEDWFESGNFCSSAGTSFAKGWHSAAAMGLIGQVNAAFAELEKAAPYHPVVELERKKFPELK